MSATTLTAPVRVNTSGVHGPPRLGRLVAVELRKMLNTRAGLWLQVAIVALTAFVVLVRVIAGNATDHAFASILTVGLQPAAVLLPIAGILLVTSEWSQRTGMITFTLLPVRSRVLGAKLLVSIALSLATLVMSVAVVAAGGLVTSTGVDGTWSDAAILIGQSAIFLTTGMVIGVAFGAVCSPRRRHRRPLRTADHMYGTSLAVLPRRRRPVDGHAPRPRPAAPRGPQRHPVGALRHRARTLDVASAPDRHWRITRREVTS